MNINFTKQGDVWVGLATITDMCTLHVERVKSGTFTIQQSSVEGGKYAFIGDTVGMTQESTIDTELVANLYPKYLRFVSSSAVTSAVINY